MRIGALTIWTAVTCGVVLAPACASAEEGFDTEHIFGFMIGTDVGNPGEREFQTQTTGRFGKGGGTYRALAQEVEIEVVPLPNFRVEVGGTASLHDITGVPDIDDRRQFNFQADTDLSEALSFSFTGSHTTVFDRNYNRQTALTVFSTILQIHFGSGDLKR